MSAVRFVLTIVPVSACMVLGSALEIAGGWLIAQGLRMIDWAGAARSEETKA